MLENVSEQGETETRRLLCPLYRIERVLVNSNCQGWRSSRFRQFLVGIATDLPEAIPQSIAGYDKVSSVGEVVKIFFSRNCLFGQEAYKIATPHELKEELQWASSRPHTVARHNPGTARKRLMSAEFADFKVVAERFASDPKDSWLAALNCRERQYLSENAAKSLRLTPEREALDRKA